MQTRNYVFQSWLNEVGYHHLLHMPRFVYMCLFFFPYPCRTHTHIYIYDFKPDENRMHISCEHTSSRLLSQTERTKLLKRTPEICEKCCKRIDLIKHISLHPAELRPREVAMCECESGKYIVKTHFLSTEGAASKNLWNIFQPNLFYSIISFTPCVLEIEGNLYNDILWLYFFRRLSGKIGMIFFLPIWRQQFTFDCQLFCLFRQKSQIDEFLTWKYSRR